MRDFGKQRNLQHVQYNTRRPQHPASRQRLNRQPGKDPGNIDSAVNIIRRLLIFFVLVAVIGVGSFAAFIGYKAVRAGASIFVGNDRTGDLPMVDAINSQSGGGAGSDLPILNWEEKRQRINILVLGLDRRSWEDASYSRTDTMILASIDPEDMTVSMVSLPRDLEVPYTDNGYTQYIRVNAVHVYGREDGDRGSGPAAAKQVVSEVLGVPVHYFVRIDFEGFRQLIDEVGGVTVDVDKTLIDYEYPDEAYGYQTVRIEAGTQVMDGDTALMYARSRHAIDPNLASDLSRAERQQKVAVALRDKVMASRWGLVSDPVKLAGLLDTLKDNILLDVSLNELVELAKLVRQIDTSDPRNISSMVLEPPLIYHEDRPGNGWRFYPADPTFEEIHEAVQSFFDNPNLSFDLEAEGAAVRFENGTAIPGIASEVSTTMRQTYAIQTEPAANANRNDYATTVIYDYSLGQAPRTVEFLEAYFGVQAYAPQEAFPGETAQVVVVLGEDYLNNQAAETEAQP